MVKGQRLALLVATGELSTAIPVVARRLEADVDVAPSLQRSGASGRVAAARAAASPRPVRVADAPRRPTPDA